MGLLDDAIREHLELKRQHGANPDEVSRQEQEAFGAARKAEFAKSEGQEPEAPAAPAEEPVAEAPPEAAVPEPEPVPEFDPAPAPEPEPAAGEPFDVESLDEPPPSAPEAEAEAEPESQAVKPGYDEDPWLEEERDEVPAGEALDHPRTERPEEQSEEDVLEETPDFLQETPEHDRLWFEQRPPRDFDWDK
jgi:hypothetical protein